MTSADCRSVSTATTTRSAWTTLSNITYDKFGSRLSMTAGNGVVTTYAYRPDNRRLLNEQATLPIGYTFNNFNFTYDQIGNLTGLQNTAQPPLSFIGSSTTTNKTQTAMQNSAVKPLITYNNTYTYPAPGSAHPHSPTAIGEFNLTTDADGNQITTQDTGTNNVNQYLFDEENRLSCTNKGPQMPSPPVSELCNVVGGITQITDGAGTETRLYGPLGEIVSETRSIPIQGGQIANYTTQFTFDTWNRIARFSIPSKSRS
jgi:hypothetical protein